MEQKKCALRDLPNDSTIHDIRRPYRNYYEKMRVPLYSRANYGPRQVIQITQSRRERGNGMAMRMATMNI